MMRCKKALRDLNIISGLVRNYKRIFRPGNSLELQQLAGGVAATLASGEVSAGTHCPSGFLCAYFKIRHQYYGGGKTLKEHIANTQCMDCHKQAYAAHIFINSLKEKRHLWSNEIVPIVRNTLAFFGPIFANEVSVTRALLTAIIQVHLFFGGLILHLAYERCQYVYMCRLQDSSQVLWTSSPRASRSRLAIFDAISTPAGKGLNTKIAIRLRLALGNDVQRTCDESGSGLGGICVFEFCMTFDKCILMAFPQNVVAIVFDVFRELCQKEVDINKGNLKSLFFPNNFIMHNTYMQWKMDATQLSNSQLVWNVKGYTGNYAGLLELRKGSTHPSEVIYTIPMTTRNTIITTESSELSFTYNTSSYSSYSSFEITWNIEKCPIELNATEGILQSHGYPIEFRSYNYECGWIISPDLPQNAKIMVNFKDFSINNPDIYMEIRDGPNNSAPLIQKLSGRSLKIPRIFSSGEQLYLKFTSNNDTGISSKFKILWSVEMCHIDLESSKGVIRSPEYPNMYPLNLNFSWTITTYSYTKIRIRFLAFDTYNINNFLEIRGGTNGSSTLIKKLYGRNQTVQDLLYPGNTLFLEFRTGNSTVCTPIYTRFLDEGQVCKGFEISWEIVYGDKFTSPLGVLHSPGFPLQYPDNFLCTWTITSLANARIRLTFSIFDTEYFVDNLEIRNGVTSSSPLITRLSGENLTLSDMVSPGSELFLRFTTDHSHAFRGFQISWSEESTQNQVEGSAVAVVVPTISSVKQKPTKVSLGCLGGCPNDAECLHIRDNIYKCLCKEGYVGPNCQPTCKIRGCPENAECVLDVNQEFTCQCLPGYTGATCQAICQVATCPLNSHCLLTNNKQYSCLCNEGYAGTTCQATCLLSGCPENAECVLNMNSQYECSCKDGFTGPTCKPTCLSSGCPENAECIINMNSQYECACKEGFTGKNCDSTCLLSGCPENAECVLNMNSQYECSCKGGFIGPTCSSICETVTCPQNSQCHPTEINQYQCVCNDGYAGPDCRSTCLSSGCPENAVCVLDMNSQYECMCKEGHTGHRCQHINVGQGDISSEGMLIKSIGKAQGVLPYSVGQTPNNFNSSAFVALQVLVILLMATLVGLAVYVIYHNKNSKKRLPYIAGD
ncbi:unnamed protein product, partial [Meganyctiphanes norvegica]